MIVVLGLNHKTAEIGVRERCHFPQDQLSDELKRLNELSSIKESLIVSTCNRVELFAEAAEADLGLMQMRQFLSNSRHVASETLDQVLYTRRHDDAVHHLFRVASSLDSMVVGEPQILGQVREALQFATQAGTAGNSLRYCFEGAFRAAKRIRTETGIVRHAVSLGSVVLEVAQKIFNSINEQVVLLVGAGEMMQETAQGLLGQGAKEILVTNRSHDKAVKLACQFQGTTFFFDKLPNYLPRADIVVTCTSHPEHLINRAMVEEASKQRTAPMFLVDLSVPRNIDETVGSLDGVYLYDLDDFSSIMADNLKKREAEVQRAEEIIAEECEKFSRKIQLQTYDPLIRSLREKISQICEQEIEKTLKKLPPLNDDQEKAINSLTRSITQKILHDPVRQIKEASPAHSHDSEFQHLIRKLFNV